MIKFIFIYFFHSLSLEIIFILNILQHNCFLNILLIECIIISLDKLLTVYLVNKTNKQSFPAFLHMMVTISREKN